MDLTRFNFLSLYGNFLCVWFIWCCWSYPLPMLLPEAKKEVLLDSGCLTVREKSLRPEVIKAAWPDSFCAGIPLLTIPQCNVSRQERDFQVLGTKRHMVSQALAACCGSTVLGSALSHHCLSWGNLRHGGE